MKKKWLIILMTMLVVFSAFDVLAEAIIETDGSAEPTAAPTSMGALNLGIKEDAKPTASPTPPVAEAGGTMMLAPGAEGAAEAGDAAETTTTTTINTPADLLDANGQPPRFGKTNKKGVNVRAKMNTKSKSEARIGVTGTAVEILEIAESGKDIWFKVRYGTATGYIRSDLLDVITEQEYVAAEAAQRSQRSSSSSSKSSGSSSSSSSNKNVVEIPTNNGSSSSVPEQSGVHLFSECTDANCSLCASDGLG